MNERLSESKNAYKKKALQQSGAWLSRLGSERIVSGIQKP